jgi:hypothetical protein
MNKSLSLLAAGLLAATGMGVAQADNMYHPGHEVLIESSDATVLGAGAMTHPATQVSRTEYVYVQPNIHWDRFIAQRQLRSNSHLGYGLDDQTRKQAAATFNVPARAGEASTMTGGAPNVATDNQLIVGSYTIPYNVVTLDGPYYVFSY